MTGTAGVGTGVAVFEPGATGLGVVVLLDFRLGPFALACSAADLLHSVHWQSLISSLLVVSQKRCGTKSLAALYESPLGCP